MKNIVALIPARSGSKGIPNKNIKNICGNPLIAYSIRVAQKSKLIDRIIVSTDSQKYADIAKFYVFVRICYNRLFNNISL